MAVENVIATRRGSFATPTPVGAGIIVNQTALATVAAAASVTSTYEFFNLPLIARILPSSLLLTDDLASSGSPVMNFGCFPINGNITAAPTGLISGLDVYTAAVDRRFLSGITTHGKMLWEILSLDPNTVNINSEVTIKATLATAACNTGGSMLLAVNYTLG